VVEQRGGEIDGGNALRRNPYKMMLSRSRRAEALRHTSEDALYSYKTMFSWVS